MVEQKDAYMRGLEAGRALLDPGLALHALVTAECARVADKHAELRANVSACETRRETARHAMQTIDYDAGPARDRLRVIQGRRDLHPARYSHFRGVAYIMAAFVVLAADFAFLTQVLSSVLQLPVAVKGPTGSPLPPLGALLTFRWQYIQPLLDLYLAAIGVVALAVPFKAWADSFQNVGYAPDRFTWRKLWSVPGLVVTIVLITIVGIASARLFLDFGAFTGGAAPSVKEIVARIVAMLIGLACPFAGAFLFSKGVDTLGESRSARDAERRCAALEKSFKPASAAVRAAEADLEAAVAACDQYDPNLHVYEGQARCVAEFRRGYADGVTQLLRDGGLGLHRKLRPQLAGAEFSTFSYHEMNRIRAFLPVRNA